MDISRESFIARMAALRCRYSNIAFLAFIEGAKFADENPDWNNPKKRLPEDGQLVLVLDKFNYIHVVRFLADSGAWVDQMDSDHEYTGIVLWTPKPKIPVLAIQDDKKED
jgi:hypothetical protein